MDSTTPPNPGQDPAAAGTGQTPVSAVQTTTGGAVQQGDYTIPQMVLDKYPELVELIKKTESMSKEERDYWFQILPIMTDEQVGRLKHILDEEAAQLTKLDKEYQGELAKLNQKHLEEWDAFEREKARETLKKEEAQVEAAEKKSEEEILTQLDSGQGQS